KLRNRANLVITIAVSPLLALLIATLLRYSEKGTYDFASAYHIPTYLFLGLIVTMFLGLTNSADDIIRDRPVLQRERNIKVRLSYYVASKTLTLAVFALAQCVLFVLIGNSVLQIRGMFWIDLAIMFMTAMSGVALGLVISSLVADPKTAANIVPLVLIPQIIMGGALIKYEDMNRNLALLYSMSHWFSEHPNPDKTVKTESKLQVPLVCQFIAMRWSYEEMIVAQAKLNPLTGRQDRANEEIQQLAPKANTPEHRARLNGLKDVLALLSGLEGQTARDVDHYLNLVDPVLAGKRAFDRLLFKDASGPVPAEQLYVNQKVSDLISNAEMEQNDYRRGNKPNVFFGYQKRYFGVKFDVFMFNTAVLIISTAGLLVLLHWILRKQLEVRRNK
ncbi:MAG TPA: ABC transporter permease, partial [Candidatus Udaeobacter sp.]|nr:ABC transporter permease [Candidatus Udaeobacter sp.]